MTYNFVLEKKFSEKHIGPFMDQFYKAYNKKDSNTKFNFDFSTVEWIANQELLVITGLLKSLITEKVPFFVTFLSRASGQTVDIRRARNIVQIWETWKIYQVMPNDKFKDFFDIDGHNVEALKKHFNITSANNEIYDRHGVTPFVSLNFIESYDDKIIGKMLNNVYKLNDATSEILQKNHCYLPFENKTLASIITKELYENFLDHSQNGIFKSIDKNAFLSIGLNRRIEEASQHLLAKNFNEEFIPEFKSFFTNPEDNLFRNRSLLQLTFTDFGAGIPTTLRSEFNIKRKLSSSAANEASDSEILEYAFEYNSSKDPLAARFSEKSVIPRGLFDLLSIVQRFNGLITIRSNYGKIFYDFSSPTNFGAQRFLESENFYPGTLINIYLPERLEEGQIESTAIKPLFSAETFSMETSATKIISIFGLTKKILALKLSKNELYSKVLEEIIESIRAPAVGRQLIYIDFKEYDLDERITKKIIYFLLSDYNINANNNVIVINPPPLEFLKQIQDEIAVLPRVVKDFTIHPLPFVNSDSKDINLFWLGLYDDFDIQTLNKLLMDIHDLRRDDFKDSNSIVGNVNYYDKYGNLKSVINRNNLADIFNKIAEASREMNIESIISSCIIKQENQIFLCNGNYYQKEYLQMYDILSEEATCDYLAKSLYEKIRVELGDAKDKIFISLTPNSTKIGKALIKQGFLLPNQIYFFESYELFIRASNSNEIKFPKNTSVILLCDVTSTGYLNPSILHALRQCDVTLQKTAVLVNAIDFNFENHDGKYTKMTSDLISLFDYPITKYRRAAISSMLTDGKTEVIRIDPFTFSPVLSNLPKPAKLQNGLNSTLLSTEEFIELLPEKYLKAGYFRNNSLIHPYFFDIGAALKDPSCSETLLSTVFSKFPEESLSKINIIFHPKDSGISQLNFDFLKDKILKNHSVEVYQIDRHNTTEGWRFPPLPLFLSKREFDTIMILDDGSCSGESLIQMINEISSLKVNNIIVLSIIDRISDHKKDFFSKINTLKNSSDESPINLQIFFGSHWHIPTYYIEESPVVTERNWLESLLEYPNLPSSIRLITQNVLSELSVKDITGSSNRFLIKTREGKPIIKDLILKKDEIGKISSYRLYKDYFNFFNEIISTYESTIQFSERYKKIELVCAVFLHEPYLFSRVKKVLPDLTEKIEEFIQTIFFGNPTREGNPKLSKDRLYHHWSNKNLIHLLFIVYQDNELTSLLNYEKLKVLISEFCQTENDLSYLLFKLLGYYPISRFDVRSCSNENIMSLLNMCIDRKELEEHTLKSLKRFRTFTMSLASAESFDTLFTKVKHNYRKLIDDEAHKHSLTVQRDILVTQIEELKNKYSTETEIIILLTWDKISPFIEDLLSFSKSFPEFFLPCEERVYNKLEKQEDSLRSIFGEINEMLANLQSTSDFDRMLVIIKQIYEEFIVSATEYFQIFVDDYKPVILDELNSFIANLTEKGFKIEQTQTNKLINEEKFVINFPTYFIKEILIGEMLKNFRHSDTSKVVKIFRTNENGYFSINIQSTILPKSQGGGGNGLSRLEKLNNMPDKTISYHHTTGGDIFNQVLKFKII